MSENTQEFSVVISKEKGADAIKKAIADAEKELGISSNSSVKKDESKRAAPGLDNIIIQIGSAFVTAIVDKYGDRFVSWLSKKLGLNKEEGEKAQESKRTSRKKGATKKAVPKRKMKK